MDSRLTLDGLKKQFADTTAVDGVHLRIRGGEVVGLLGPNGAGKTTTFYMAVGMLRPDAGNVRLNGGDITADPMYIRARKGIGYLPQERSVFRKLTVMENLLMVLETLPLPPRLRTEKADALLSELGIAHLAGRRSGTLSGGERRRLEISRALSTGPAFMLLDEPFAGVDPLAVTEIRHIVGHLKAKGIGILISDHNVRETLVACDRAYILHEGRVIESGPPAAIAASEPVRRAYLGDEFRL
jgi:lipopolysaccharide export system ATP-binding protein